MINTINKIDREDLVIFLVDDQKITNFINKKLIEITGICKNVYDFTNPKTALENLEIHQPSLILLDLNMPEINGWKFLERMEKYSTSADVIIVTSSTSTLDQEKAKSYSRVVNYYTKPLNKYIFHTLAEKYQKKMSS